MAIYLDKLLSFTSEPIVASRPTIQFSSDERSLVIEHDLADMLMRRNGFFCFLSALHIFPVQSAAGCYGLADWNEFGLWKEAYAGLGDNLLCFAEDIFANQFAIRDNSIVLFRAETGETTMFAASLEQWAERILSYYDYITGYTFARDWQHVNGPLQIGMRLCPTVPFIVGGKYKMSNMNVVESAKLLRGLGTFAKQIYGKPDGTTVKLDLDK